MASFASQSGKKLILMIVIVAILVVAVGGGAVLGSRLLKHDKKSDKHKTEKVADKDAGDEESGKSDKAGKDDSKSADDEDAATDGEEDEDKDADESKQSEKKGKEEKPEVVSLGDFLVNLSSASGVRYLRAEISVSLTGLPPAKGEHGKGGPSLPPGDLAIARDRVVAVLSAGEFAQLRATSARDALKQKILMRLQKALPQYELSEVLFTSFVMQ